MGVALDLPLDTLFTYRVPAALCARAGPGFRVRVPFRGRPRVGIVAEAPAPPRPGRVLDVLDAPDAEPVLGPDLLELGRFVARYYGASLGEALAAMLPRGVRHRRAGRERVEARATPEGAAAWQAQAEDLADAQRRVLRHLVRAADWLPLGALLQTARVSASPVRTLARRGLVELARRRDVADPLVAATRAPGPPAPPPTPTAEQVRALQRIEAALGAGGYAAFLLLGVTGSGKTEVYLRAIEAARRQGRQALVLVPEIALTPQTVARFAARFERVAVLHSAQGEAERAAAWRCIRAGEVDVVIGPRSAVFAPVPRLGLVVVDEEHETSFKQQNAPRYHARDVALVRARDAGAVVVLGSATPALESWANAQEGRYGLLRLRERVPGRRLPTVQVVDVGAPDEQPGGRSRFSRTLRVRLREALAEGGQAILFQNRRGFATSAACARCGFVLRCTECDLALTYHRSETRALCHLCGHERALPRACPECALPGLALRGAGTQTIEAELASIAPGAVVARMDSDTMTRREAYEEVLGRFGRREVDILVGTQMLAKGLDFPGVTLVGIVSADLSLAQPDLRANERTFQLLAQVAGRAGRGERDGRVVIQTRLPDHPAVRWAAAQDFESFAAEELRERRAHAYPPYARLLRVLVRGASPEAVAARARAVQERAVRHAGTGCQVLGPAPPPVARVQGQWREQILVKAPDHREIARVLAALRAAPRPRARVEESYDVDPYGA